MITFLESLIDSDVINEDIAEFAAGDDTGSNFHLSDIQHVSLLKITAIPSCILLLGRSALNLRIKVLLQNVQIYVILFFIIYKMLLKLTIYLRVTLSDSLK